MSTLPSDFEQIAAQAWEQGRTFLERCYDRWLGEGWEPDPARTTYKIYQLATPAACHICGSTVDWVIEGDDIKVFVCDHGLESGVIRKVDSVPAAEVTYFEQTN